jgi:transposase-like protein
VPKSIIDVHADFPNEIACLAFLEKMRWPDGVKCLACESDRISKFTVKETTRTRVNKKTGEVTTSTVPARHLYQCLECGRQFTPTVGTLFNDSHLSLQKWLIAVALVCNAKKGLSAKQMQRGLGCTYKTAWYLNHRIRKAMVEGVEGLFTGAVEVDETYVGGKYDRRLKRAKGEKEPVVGMIERGGKLRTFHVKKVNRTTVVGKINENIAAEPELVITDQTPSTTHCTKPTGTRA